jgi:hypothetical protein
MSLQLARSVGADYEIAHTLQSYARFLRTMGLPSHEELRESLAIQQRLGIVSPSDHAQQSGVS